MRIALLCVICITCAPHVWGSLDSVAYHIVGAVEDGDYTVETGKAAIRGIYREADDTDRHEIQGIYTASPFYGDADELIMNYVQPY